jgi:hypothetical protein
MLTERLALRRFTTDDAANLLSLDGDPQVMRFLTGTTTLPAPIQPLRPVDTAGPGMAFGRVRGRGRITN